jgi:hypothetical protein
MVHQEVMQVPLGVDVVKGLGVDSKGSDPKVELTSSQHNHLLDQDLVAVVRDPALRPIGAREQGRQEGIGRHENLLDLPLPERHLETNKSHPLYRSTCFGRHIGAEQEGTRLDVEFHLHPPRREPIERGLGRRKLLDLVGSERMGGRVVSNGTYSWQRYSCSCSRRSSTTNSELVARGRSSKLCFARNLLER